MIQIDLKLITEMKILLCLIMQILHYWLESLGVQVNHKLCGQLKELCKLGILKDTYGEVQSLLVLLLNVLGKAVILGQSQHYAGTAFDVAQLWTNERRAALRISAINSGVWSYVEPVSISPTWVHFDRRQKPPACSSGGYPTLRRGSLSVYVLILQDGLNTLGFNTGGLDGIFGSRTFEAVKAYQTSRGLASDGIVGCNTWRSLQENVIGKGRTSTTID